MKKIIVLISGLFVLSACESTGLSGYLPSYDGIYVQADTFNVYKTVNKVKRSKSTEDEKSKDIKSACDQIAEKDVKAKITGLNNRSVIKIENQKLLTCILNEKGEEVCEFKAEFVGNTITGIEGEELYRIRVSLDEDGNLEYVSATKGGKEQISTLSSNEKSFKRIEATEVESAHLAIKSSKL